MRLNDICSVVYPACPNIKSKNSFIRKLFEAAGNGCISDSYARKLFTGEKKFVDELKIPLRGKDNLIPLFDFFHKEISNVIMVLVGFGIPEKEQANKKAIAIALAHQIKLLIDSHEENVEDILDFQYQYAKRTDDLTVSNYEVPLYSGDSVSVIQKRLHEIQSYDIVEHTWELVNSGSIVWKERKLIYKRGIKDRPEANPNTIEIPVVEPGNRIKITTTIDGRGFDGVTHCMWEMIDSDGENCFPGRETLFSVTIDAKFKR